MAQPRNLAEQAFKDAEASLLLSGLTPSGYYYTIKERILNEEMTTQEGKEALIAYHSGLNAGRGSPRR